MQTISRTLSDSKLKPRILTVADSKLKPTIEIGGKHRAVLIGRLSASDTVKRRENIIWKDIIKDIINKKKSNALIVDFMAILRRFTSVDICGINTFGALVDLLLNIILL